MEEQCDDVLNLIASFLHDPNDRKSLAQVNKRFLRRERLTRLSLRVFEPNLLYKFLSSFPNLLKFESSKPIKNSHLGTLSKKCPKIEVLNLELASRFYDDLGEFPGLTDVGDDGICDIAKQCRQLREVNLRRRKGVGNYAVIMLVTFARNLINLDLGRCQLVTNLALEAIGESITITSLNLQGCSGITYEGLVWLAKGPVSKSLKTLILSECDQILNYGVWLLHRMPCLEVLDISYCGPDLVDSGCSHIAKIGTLKELNLSHLGKLTDATVIAIAQNCLGLEALNLTGCANITGDGIRALSNHGSLKSLVLDFCYIFSHNDVEQMVVRSRSLRHIVLAARMETLMPKTVQDNIKKHCVLEWRELMPLQK